MTLNQLVAGETVFHEGYALANSAAWKNKQLAGNHITALLVAVVALARLFGFDLAIDADTLSTVGMGLAATVSIANSLLTVATSTKIGIKQSKAT